MSETECIARLGGMEGCRGGTVTRCEAGEKGPHAEAWIELLAASDVVMRCSCCGQLVEQAHEYATCWVLDLPI